MAIDLAGGGDYIDLGSNASIDSIVAKSITAWVNITSSGVTWFGGKEYIPNGQGYQGWQFGVSASGGVMYYRGCSGTPGHWISSACVTSTSLWYHLAWTHTTSGGSTAAPIQYCNGVAVSAVQQLGQAGGLISDAAMSLYLGRWDNLNGGPFYYPYRMEDFRLFNRILAAQEIANLAGGYRGALGGEVAWLQLDLPDKATVSSAAAALQDMSGTGNNGTAQHACVGYASFANRVSGWIP